VTGPTVALQGTSGSPPRTLTNVSTAPSLEPILVRTVGLRDSDPLLDRLPLAGPLAWVRHGGGLVGWGEAARLVVRGGDRFERAVHWWRSFIAHAAVDDEVRLPGSGAVVFGSFAFEDEPAPSVLVVPSIVVGRRAGRTWLTTIGDGIARSEPRTLPIPPGAIRYSEGALSATAWRDTVAEAVARIHDGELKKVVLARDLIATARPVDVRHLLAGLAERYPACFTFSVDGLVGATPELLVRRHGDLVTSQVLAGTAWRREAGDDEDRLAAGLLGSAKNLEEHAYAASSAADALAPYCSELTVPQSPTVMRFADILHLATEVTGRLGDGATALDLAGTLHPTAAVCGTPTEIARKVIRDLEGMDRGRYAGPVGWMDASGDGEWGIALRCAEVAGSRLRLFAGCGIVAGSDPDSELAEAQAKFVAVRNALES
jgi:menaquinone-specific isochorismate synthase